MTCPDASDRERITAAIEEYLVVLQRKPDDDLKGLAELARALDRLVICYHEAPDVEPDTADGPEAPRVDEQAIMERAGAAFPDLGWYPLVDVQTGEDQTPWASDAIGDLVEIAADLIDVLWLFEHATLNDAIWEFRFGYQTHWGKHLHEVRTYLHSQAAW